MNDLVAAANALRALHVPGKPLLLANIWDAASARVAKAAGFPVVATSSGAVAESLGFQDSHAPADEMLAAAARICRAVDVPVTVDAEAGYGLSADELVSRLVAAGAVGCNLEDTEYLATGHRLRPLAEQASWLREVRAATDRIGVPLVLNARIDVFIRRPAERNSEPELVPAAVQRARAYLDAGADCVYPIAMRDANSIQHLIAELTPAAVNVNPLAGRPLHDLAELGAARVSMGAGVWRQTLSVLADRLAEIAAD